MPEHAERNEIAGGKHDRTRRGRIPDPGAKHYTDAEARAELGSLTSGEFESLTVSDADGADYLITYDAGAGAFIVTASYRPG